MGGNRLTIFDTTLRDGEQAPGFSLRIDEKLKMAHQLRTLGVDIIEAGFPIASEADAEAVRMVCDARPRPCHCRPRALQRAGHRARGVGADAGPPASNPRLHRDLRSSSRAQAAHDARRVPADGDGRGPSGAQVHRRRAVFGGGCDAQRPRLPVAGRRSRDPVRRDHDQPAGYGRLLDA